MTSPTPSAARVRCAVSPGWTAAGRHHSVAGVRAAPNRSARRPGRPGGRGRQDHALWGSAANPGRPTCRRGRVDRPRCRLGWVVRPRYRLGWAGRPTCRPGWVVRPTCRPGWAGRPRCRRGRFRTGKGRQSPPTPAALRAPDRTPSRVETVAGQASPRSPGSAVRNPRRAVLPSGWGWSAVPGRRRVVPRAVRGWCRAVLPAGRRRGRGRGWDVLGRCRAVLPDGRGRCRGRGRDVLGRRRSVLPGGRAWGCGLEPGGRERGWRAARVGLVVLRGVRRPRWSRGWCRLGSRRRRGTPGGSRRVRGPAASRRILARPRTGGWVRGGGRGRPGWRRGRRKGPSIRVGGFRQRVVRGRRRRGAGRRMTAAARGGSAARAGRGASGRVGCRATDRGTAPACPAREAARPGRPGARPVAPGGSCRPPAGPADRPAGLRRAQGRGRRAGRRKARRHSRRAVARTASGRSRAPERGPGAARNRTPVTDRSRREPRTTAAPGRSPYPDRARPAPRETTAGPGRTRWAAVQCHTPRAAVARTHRGRRDEPRGHRHTAGAAAAPARRVEAADRRIRIRSTEDPRTQDVPGTPAPPTRPRRSACARPGGGARGRRDSADPAAAPIPR